MVSNSLVQLVFIDTCNRLCIPIYMAAMCLLHDKHIEMDNGECIVCWTLFPDGGLCMTIDIGSWHMMYRFSPDGSIIN